MQIGEFARICRTKISVLRHYDKEGLLIPDYVDAFTGYRYYSKEQITVFNRINAFKKAGFSLSEIREILKNGKNREEIIILFEKKKTELNKKLLNLEEARHMVLGTVLNDNVRFIETSDGFTAVTHVSNEEKYDDVCKSMENDLHTQGYQRTSAYVFDSESGEISCHAVRLTANLIDLNENIDLPFENDTSIVGKWEIIGEFAVKEDFYSGKFEKDTELTAKNIIYFLPDGARYWLYGWTKNKLLFRTGDSSSVNDFTTERRDNENYMFVNFKSYYYRHGGKPTVLVLRQLDNKSYSADAIARKDDINKSFIPDNRILGKWKAFDYCRCKQDFDLKKARRSDLFFSAIEFLPDGELTSCYDFGKSVIKGREVQEWTKGFVLRKWNSTACAYELCTINDTEYLFIEWKSGDYIYGGFDPSYYVFVRE